MSSIGPDLPPHLLAKRKRQAEEEQQESQTKQQLPQQSPPNSPKRTKIAGPSLPSPSPPRRVLGPSAPPAPLSERPTNPPQPAENEHPNSDSNSDSDSDDDDDDYGPALPTAGDSTAAILPEPTLHEAIHKEQEQPDTHKPQRSDWMTLPPAVDGLRNIDPSRQRARGFNTSRSGAGTNSSGGIAAQWTETPEEKRKRLANQVLGISTDDPLMSAVQSRAVKKTNEDHQIKRRVEESRGESLLARHQRGTKGEGKKDDPSKRGFDWDKDMNSGTVLSESTKKDLMNGSSNFNSKFSGGGYL